MAAPSLDAPDAVVLRGRRILLIFLAGAILYVAFAALADAQALTTVLGRLSWRHVLAALGLVVLSMIVRSARWWIYRHKLGVRATFTTGLLLGAPQGRTGLVAKATHLRERGVRYGLAIPAVVAERATEGLAMGILLLVGTIGAPPALRVLGFVGALLPLIYVVLLQRPRLVEPLLRVFERWHVARHRVHDVRLALAELPPLLRGTVFLGSILTSVLGVGLEGAALWAIAQGLGFHLTLLQALFVYFLGDVAGAASLLPAGIGVAEGGMAVALLAMGLALPEAAAITLATRACTLWFSLALGVGAALAVPRARKAQRTTPPPTAR